MKRFLIACDDAGHLEGTRPERHGDLEVWCRGYLADRQGLREQVVPPGAVAGAAGDGAVGDGELLAWAYRHWGERLPVHVDGHYAAAIFDRPRKTVLLIHDVLGLVPLYYEATPHRLLIASHLADMVKARGSGDLDNEYIARYLATSSSSGQGTPYRGVRRLAMGETVCWSAGRERRQRVWDLADVAPVQLPDPRDYAERFRELTFQAVRSAREGAGPAICELSGGLDSSSVLSIAAETGTADLAALSYTYPRHRHTDESPWIQAVLQRHPVPWHNLNADECLPFSRLPEEVWGEPQCSLIDWGLRQRCAEILRAAGSEVLLTGQGGDLVCFGPGCEPFYLADRFFSATPWRGVGELRRWRSEDPQRRSGLYWWLNYVVRPWLRHVARRPLGQISKGKPPPWLAPEWRRLAERAGRGGGGAEPRSRAVGDQWFRERLTAVCRQVAGLGQDPVQFEFRHPLLSRPLVEFMYAIAWQQKLDPAGDRPLQRRALGDILPPAVCQRRYKVVFDQPLFEGLRSGTEWLEALSDRPRLVDRGLVDAGPWQKAVTQARLGFTCSLPAFVAAATLEVWLRQLESLPQGTSGIASCSPRPEEFADESVSVRGTGR